MRDVVRRLLVVDDHTAVAEAIALLARSDGWEEVAIADTTLRALDAADRLRPNAVTVDLNLGTDDGHDLLVKLRAAHPHTALVVLTATGTLEEAIRCLRTGIDGFVPKSAPPDDLLAALRAATAGNLWLPADLIGPVIRALLDPQPINEWEQLVSTLSPREHEVLELMVAGLGRRQIAERLTISLNTARTHAKNIHTKLGVHASLEAVSLALRAGIRPPDLSQPPPADRGARRS